VGKSRARRSAGISRGLFSRELESQQGRPQKNAVVLAPVLQDGDDADGFDIPRPMNFLQRSARYTSFKISVPSLTRSAARLRWTGIFELLLRR
jgi:hypothetical protein